MKELKEIVNQLFDTVVNHYRQLHQIHETKNPEESTTNYICQVLDELGIPYKKQTAGNGLIAILEGKGGNKGKVVALHADMDSQSVQNASGQVHICGHEVHVASLLGAMAVLQQMKGQFTGAVKAIFQPTLVGEEIGAKFMIEQNALENPKVDVIIGQQITTSMNAGTAGFKSGAFMSSVDKIYLTIQGKGGNAENPSEYINPVNAGATIIEKLQHYIREESPADTPTYLSFGKFIAEGDTDNVPETVTIEGSLRTYNEVWREELFAIMKKIVKDTAIENKVKYDLDIRHGYPSLTNNPTVTQNAKKDATDFLGKQYVFSLLQRMTAEDFAYYLQRRPGVFYQFGVDGSGSGEEFKINEEAFKSTVGLMCWITLQELKR
ncbi:MAG: amidohydrolase [Bacteroidales bacterium]|nr:amidohydrolase [Bacteroidales bacterium]